jgi:hypothetical protein
MNQLDPRPQEEQPEPKTAYYETMFIYFLYALGLAVTVPALLVNIYHHIYGF